MGVAATSAPLAGAKCHSPHPGLKCLDEGAADNRFMGFGGDFGQQEMLGACCDC